MIVPDIDRNSSFNGLSLLFIVVGILIGMLIGFFTLKGSDSGVDKEISEVKNADYIVVYNGEEQTFRDAEGHRVKLIEQDGVLYMPITEKGLFFDKDIQIVGNKVIVNDYDKPSVLNFDTVTIKGERFTSETFYNYSYTMLLNWDTWCPDCDKLLNKIAENKELIESLNIQIVGVPYISKDTDLIEYDKEVDKILNEKGLSFSNILPTTEIENLVQTNLTNIPTLIIVDNKGRVLTKDSDVEIDLKGLLENIHTFDICSEC